MKERAVMPDSFGCDALIRRTSNANCAEPPSSSEGVFSLDVVMSKEEKEYQLQVLEKLQAVEAWDYRNSRQYKIG